MSKQALITVVCVLIGAGATIFFVRNIRHKQDPTYRQAIKDSIVIATKQADIHRDSAAFYTQVRKNNEYKLDSLNRLDSAAMAPLRQAYSAALIRKLESQVRPGRAGLSDTLRIP